MRSILKNLAVWVAALGYFVDIYDLLLFSIIRVPSLESLGVENLFESGLLIINMQMFGLLLGGILWGVLGDRLGRTRVLFLSILLYSAANIVNGFVVNAEQYTWIRFVAGIGLAGELGAGITLVSELLSKENRGLGTSLVAGIGLTGAVAAFFIAQTFDWRTCYFIGGGMGLMLLALRLGVFESSLFEKTVRNRSVQRGNFFHLFATRSRALRYLRCILIGLPTWFVIGILVSFSKEFGVYLGIETPIDPGRGILYAYAAIAIGDVLIGLLSQYLRSRKKGAPRLLWNHHPGHGALLFRYECFHALFRVWCSRFWYGFLGHLRDHWGGKFWHQPSRDGGHHHSQHGARFLEWHFRPLSLFSGPNRVHPGRHLDGSDCDGGDVLGNWGLGRDLWEGFGLSRGISFKELKV